MTVSPDYDEIKARALEMLESPAGFNGHSREVILSWKRGRDRWVMLRNSVRVALCRARDEVEGRHTASAGKAGRFNIGNFRKAEAEIARKLRTQ
jgi:hypothetical protein